MSNATQLPVDRPPRRLRRVELVVVLVLAGLYWGMAVSASMQKSATFDEPQHLMAGYTYWQLDDYRIGPENGHLPQRWAALPLLFMGVQWSGPEERGWKASSDGMLSSDLLYGGGNDAARLLLAGRSMIALLGAALVIVVFLWSRSLFGTWSGVLSAVLCAFCPTTLAHGGLVTSDMCAELLFTIVAWLIWSALQELSWWTLAGLSLAVPALLLSKMSGVLILPMAVVMVAVRLAAGRPMTVALRGVRTITSRGQQAALILATTAVVALVSWVCIWGAFGFRYSARNGALPGPTEVFDPSLDVILAKPGAANRVLAFTREHRLLPEAYLWGAAFTSMHSEHRLSFLNGRYGMTGFHSFFPFALVAKTPLSLLALLALGLAAVLRARRRERTEEATGEDRSIARPLLYGLTPLAVLLAVYWLVALASNLNIGHRHLLPTYPAMFVLAGASVSGILRWGAARGLAVLLLLAFVGESLWIRPDYLAYFSPLVGGPRSGYTHLVDSSLDWGQDLPALEAWMDEHHVDKESAYVSYFGTAALGYHGIDAKRLPCFPPQSPQDIPQPLKPGVYCISASMLQRVYLPDAFGEWNREFEKKYRALLPRVSRADAMRNDPAALSALFGERPKPEILGFFGVFEQLRLARLCTALRRREPDDMIHYSILIYRVSEQELEAALTGDPVELLELPSLRK